MRAVVGSSIEERDESFDHEAVAVRLPEIHFIDDKTTKPLAVNRFIGRRPILAAGNFDSDFELLEWSTTGTGNHLGSLAHRADSEARWAFDRQSPEGCLDRSVREAYAMGWPLLDMARDWQCIYS